MFLGISVVIWVLAIILIVIALAFLFYRQVIHANLVVITLLFPLSFLIAMSALFIPGIYHSLTDTALSETQFAQQLKSVDSTLTTAGNAPSNLLNDIQKLFNPNNSNQNSQYKSELYPQLVNLLSEVLRWLIFIFAFIVMILVAYSRYAFSSVFQVDKLERRVSELEKKFETKNA